MGGSIGYIQQQNQDPRETPMAVSIESNIASQPISPTSPTAQSRPRLAIKRSRDPPKNNAGQIYCDHIDCRDSPVIFRRPCEWKYVNAVSSPCVFSFLFLLLFHLIYSILILFSASTWINTTDPTNATIQTVPNYRGLPIRVDCSATNEKCIGCTPKERN